MLLQDVAINRVHEPDEGWLLGSVGQRLVLISVALAEEVVGKTRLELNLPDVVDEVLKVPLCEGKVTTRRKVCRDRRLKTFASHQNGELWATEKKKQLRHRDEEASDRREGRCWARVQTISMPICLRTASMHLDCLDFDCDLVQLQPCTAIAAIWPRA